MDSQGNDSQNNDSQNNGSQNRDSQKKDRPATGATVCHQKEQHRFVIALEGKLAVLEYRLDGGQIDFQRTYVPTELRGHGLAQRLVEQGLNWAREQGLGIHASCWYVQKYL
jgi:uncharacterized protein